MHSNDNDDNNDNDVDHIVCPGWGSNPHDS